MNRLLKKSREGTQNSEKTVTVPVEIFAFE